MKIVKLFMIVGICMCIGACGGPKAEDVTLRPLGNQMKYMTREITVKAGIELTLILENTATEAAMIHNIVVLKKGASPEDVATMALTAPNNEVTHPDVIAKTDYAKPGETVSVTFTVPESGTYTYICTYPGHVKTMQGSLIVE